MGERECATGSPMTASRTGGAKDEKLAGLEIKSSAEKMSGASM
jgi:hypothetical protein